MAHLILEEHKGRRLPTGLKVSETCLQYADKVEKFYSYDWRTESKVCEPGHEKTCLMSYANNKGADQPAHPRSLISACVVRCLVCVMSLVTVTKNSSLMLASVAEQASLSLTWSETPEDTFSHDEAHVHVYEVTTVSRSMTKPNNITCAVRS